jgi:hypothetical protein
MSKQDPNERIKINITDSNMKSSDVAGGNIYKNKSIRISLSILAIFAVAFGGYISIKTNLIQIFTGQESVQPETQRSSPNALPPPVSSTPKTVVIKPEDQLTSAYSGTNEIVLTCGASRNLSGVEIVAECPLDKNKDDRPDGRFGYINLINKANQVRDVTFDGIAKLNRGFIQKAIYNTYSPLESVATDGSMAIPDKQPSFRLSQGSDSSSWKSSVSLSPGASVSFYVSLEDDAYKTKLSLPIGLGRPTVSTKDVGDISLSCPTSSKQAESNDEKLVYGVKAILSCKVRSSGGMDLPVPGVNFENNAASVRVIQARIEYEGVAWDYLSQLSPRKSVNIRFLPSTEGTVIKASVGIP